MKERTKQAYVSDFRRITAMAESIGFDVTDDGKWSVMYVEEARLDGLSGASIIRHLSAAVWYGLKVSPLARRRADLFVREDRQPPTFLIEGRHWIERILSADPSQLVDRRTQQMVTLAAVDQLSSGEIARDLGLSVETIRRLLREEGKPRGLRLTHIQDWGFQRMKYGYAIDLYGEAL